MKRDLKTEENNYQIMYFGRHSKSFFAKIVCVAFQDHK
jgi:hypothetical protein